MGKKTRIRDSYLTNARNRNLLSAYEAVIKKYGVLSKSLSKELLIKEAIKTPPKEFYITFYTAKDIINKMLKTPTQKGIVIDE